MSVPTASLISTNSTDEDNRQASTRRHENWAEENEADATVIKKRSSAEQLAYLVRLVFNLGDLGWNLLCNFELGDVISLKHALITMLNEVLCCECLLK